MVVKNWKHLLGGGGGGVGGRTESYFIEKDNMMILSTLRIPLK